MTKRYDVINMAEPRGQSVTDNGIPCTARTCCTRLNRLTEENEQLKAQLHCPFDSICSICNNEYLVKKDNYYISKCKKRHEECSKIDMVYCSDFKKKDEGDME